MGIINEIFIPGETYRGAIDGTFFVVEDVREVKNTLNTPSGRELTTEKTMVFFKDGITGVPYKPIELRHAQWLLLKKVEVTADA